MTSRRWWNVAAALLILLLLVCPNAHAQLVCPEIAGDMVLVHDSSPDDMGRITGQVKDGTAGRSSSTVCTGTRIAPRAIASATGR